MDWARTKEVKPDPGVPVVGWWNEVGGDPDVVYRDEYDLWHFTNGRVVDAPPDYWTQITAPEPESQQ